jgi:nucleoside-diphosphate-sugar epimerase
MWVLVGCGYTGSRLAQRLVAEGAEVVAAARRAAPAIAGARNIHFDDQSTATAIPAAGATVVWLAPPGPDVTRLAEVSRLAERFVYVSSTGVYGPGHGDWVDETAPLEPITHSGRARVVAEAAISTDSIILRPAGIYGPVRGLVERLRAGSYRIIGDGTSHVSRIHVDDLVTAILAAARSTATGPVNVADDDPAPIGELADRIAAQLGVAPPPRIDPSTVDAEVAGMLTADRKIANQRMKRELGVELKFPRVVVGA